jgi:hypothetical protein
MNVCFAICITLLIYQNTQLKDDIRYLKINSLNDYEVMAIAQYEAESVVESCEVSGRAKEEGSYMYMEINC